MSYDTLIVAGLVEMSLITLTKWIYGIRASVDTHSGTAKGSVADLRLLNQRPDGEVC